MCNENELKITPFIDINALKDEYARLANLKNIFGLKNDDFINIKQAVRTKANYYNYDNAGLLQYIVGSIYYAPDIIKNEFNNLKHCYNNEKKYKKKYSEIRKLFNSDKTFIKYKNIVHNNLFLYYFSPFYANSMFYEFAEDYLNRFIYIEPNNIVMNFHFLISWFDDNLQKVPEQLTENEILLCDLILANYDLSEIFTSNLMPEFENMLDITNIADYILPQKMYVKSFTQAIAKYIILKCKFKNYQSFNMNKYEYLRSIYYKTIMKEEY